MTSKYSIIYIITFLLLLLSITISVMNYSVALNNTQVQLRNATLPLSTDNIYSEIQKNLIEPNLVASMMAQDTFLKDWLIHEEKNESKIKAYLESIKNKYKMSTVFLASQSTYHYYLARGLIEEMKEDNPTNAWYYTFRNKAVTHEINIDFNEYIDNEIIMFINHKIFDKEFHMLGATGVGLKIAYIDDMLEKFRKEYKFKVLFVKKDGQLMLYEKHANSIKNIKENIALYSHSDKLFTSKSSVVEYKNKDGDSYLVQSKYIQELDLYLLVEAKISDFTDNLLNTFYLNLFLSLLISIVILFVFIKIIKTHNSKIENLANHDTLTKLPNRRLFTQRLENLLVLQKRNLLDISVLFFDIDDFKKVNDTFGHDIGDKVLMRIAKIMKESLRESDLQARWGGEEFIIAFVNSSLEHSKKQADKLRTTIENDKDLSSLVDYKITASFGLTQIKEDDIFENILKRADSSLYKAKDNGKNQVVLG